MKYCISFVITLNKSVIKVIKNSQQASMADVYIHPPERRSG
ncbi:hypothetical protein BN1221_04734 [Brenneria goodwinii]|uniref:Uncharacterized protein n=1 Tax=Brenneria goodwinii TaxID=1109412 RepID=A0A0G4K224_9GAMM|nr:hypothetical protein BN1221_04734 [Brenneria goodwinii]